MIQKLVDERCTGSKRGSSSSSPVSVSLRILATLDRRYAWFRNEGSQDSVEVEHESLVSCCYHSLARPASLLDSLTLRFPVPSLQR